MSLPISGFMPIPLAIMPPFMAYQSLVMGDAFGRAFQFGKRKISAMSNEQFNALNITQMFEQISNEYTRMIPTVEKAMQQSLELQVTIVKELLKTLPAIGQMLNELGIEATGKTLDELAHLIGMHFGHDEGGSSTPAPTPSPIVTECPTGWHWDSGAQQCVPDVQSTPIPTVTEHHQVMWFALNMDTKLTELTQIKSQFAALRPESAYVRHKELQRKQVSAQGATYISMQAVVYYTGGTTGHYSGEASHT